MDLPTFLSRTGWGNIICFRRLNCCSVKSMFFSLYKTSLSTRVEILTRVSRACWFFANVYLLASRRGRTTSQQNWHSFVHFIFRTKVCVNHQTTCDAILWHSKNGRQFPTFVVVEEFYREIHLAACLETPKPKWIERQRQVVVPKPKSRRLFWIREKTEREAWRQSILPCCTRLVKWQACFPKPEPSLSFECCTVSVGQSSRRDVWCRGCDDDVGEQRSGSPESFVTEL